MELIAEGNTIPHPAKLDTGGEDRFLIDEKNNMCVVADGVGGWDILGVDPGIFTHKLLENCKSVVSKNPKYSPLQIMQEAYDQLLKTNCEGSCTCCIVKLYNENNKTILKYANLGDSGFRVIRGNKLLFRSKEQCKMFNFPYQLGSNGRGYADTPDQSDEGEINLENGDIIIMGTDGLFDNVFDDDLVSRCIEQKENTNDKKKIVSTCVMELCKYAQNISISRTAETPFGFNAARAALNWPGGKEDDITVVAIQYK